MKNTVIVVFFITFFTHFIKAQNIGSENLFSVFPTSSFTDNTTGVFTFSSTFSSSNSAWEIDWNETEVFSKLFKFDHPTNTNESFELRFGKGGQIYSFKSSFGEAIPPQWRPKYNESGSVISSDTQSIVNGEILSEKGNWAPWVDEIWQLVSSDQNDFTTEMESGVPVEKVNTRNIHQAGSYLNNFAHRSSDLTSPFYSPIVASNFNEAKQEYNMVIWAQSENPSYVYDGRSDCNPCHPDRFKPFSLYYLRYKNIGDGVVQVDYLIYNYHKTRETNFFNVPFLGIRNSVLPHFFLSNPDTSYSLTTMPNFADGVTKRNTLTNGWAAFSGSADGNSPSLGFVFGNNTNGYADFRYGNALGPDNIRDATVLSYRLLKANDNYWTLKEGKSFSGTYFMVLGSNMGEISNKIQTKNLVSLANTELTDITFANSNNIYYKITLDGLGGYTIAESTAADNTLSFKSSPFKNSSPVFLIEATNGNSILTYDPYYYSLKPYDGLVSSIKLLGFSDSELTINPLTYQKPVLTTLHSPDECTTLTTVGGNNSTYTEVVTNPVVSDTANPNVSSFLALANNGSTFLDLGYSITTGTSLDWSFRYYTANSGSLNTGTGTYIVRLYNRTLGTGTYHQITLGDKIGGSWQTVTGTADLSTTTTGNIADIAANGGFDSILILPSNNASAIETLYVDDLKFSGVPDTNLSDTTADLDAGKAWLYDNSSNNFNTESVLNILSGTVEENQVTPSTNGNSSATVLKFTRGNDNASSGIRFKVPTAFNYATTTLKFRVFAVCNLNAIANFRLQVRFNDSGTGALNYTVQNIEENKWVEFSVDLTSPNTGTPTADNLYTDLYFFMNSGDATSGSNGQVYYFDSIQLTAQTSTFDGDTDSDWGTATNWSNDVLPNSLYNISIPSGQNVTIGATTGATANNLTVDGAGSLTVNAGGSLIVNGTSTGNVTYNRTLNFTSGNANGWHLVSSPVAGQTFNESFASTNNLALSSGKRGFAYYNDALAVGSKYVYLLSDDTNASAFNSGTYSGSGVGYSAKIAATGTVGFTGTINTSDVNGVSVTSSGNGFNLLGNPYTSYVSSQTLLNANPNTSGVIYTWTEGGGYTTRTAASNWIIPPGQGFFVKMNSGSTFDFAESNQSSGTQAFQKSAGLLTKVKLMVNDGSLNRYAEVQYFDTNATKGYDWGYDGEIFTGQSDALEIYSHLLEGSAGKNYQIQSLPNSDYENMVISIGVKAAAGKEITFTVDAMNLPTGVKVFFEDRANNTFTELSNNGNYKVTTTEVLNGIGRFYLHTKSSALSADDTILNTVSIYKTNNTTLRISGLSQGSSTIKLFNILGKEVLTKKFEANNVNDINLPKLATGIYIVQLETASGKLNKKIILE